MSRTQRDGTKWPSCTPCNTIWRQTGNRTGHCSQCHRTFQGGGAFDRHQSTQGGVVTCNDPGSLGETYEATTGDGEHDAGVTYWSLRPSEQFLAWRESKRSEASR